jgi:hypothetical protein
MEEFNVGDAVFYIPVHAKGDLLHCDVEKGVVTSQNREYVFVKFGQAVHGLACKRDQLKKARPISI